MYEQTIYLNSCALTLRNRLISSINCGLDNSLALPPAAELVSLHSESEFEAWNVNVEEWLGGLPRFRTHWHSCPLRVGPTLRCYLGQNLSCHCFPESKLSRSWLEAKSKMSQCTRRWTVMIRDHILRFNYDHRTTFCLTSSICNWDVFWVSSRMLKSTLRA